MFWLCALLLLLPVPALAQNIILILADDLGNDMMSELTYGEEHLNQDPLTLMPTLDTMAADGVLFRHAYSNSVCSPTRATLMTGHNAAHYRNQIVRVTGNDAVAWALLDTSWDNLPVILNDAGYRTEVYGKWHLAWAPEYTRIPHDTDEIVSRTESHPNDFGFDHAVTMHTGPITSPYTDWKKWTNGVYSNEADYNTSYLVDQVISAGDATKGIRGSEPFFIYLPFAAPHTPLHEPPEDLITVAHYSGGWDDPKRYAAMIEAMDTEIGRLFDDANFDWSDTTVIFMGDNGTPGAVCVGHPLTHCKSTAYEGGINVPLIIRGQAVAEAAKGQVSDGLVQATDVFATIVEIAGTTPVSPGRDAVSLKSYLITPGQDSLRSHVTIQYGSPNGGPFVTLPTANWGATGRDSRYKYDFGLDEFYDLDDDPYEASPLDQGALNEEQQAAYDGILAWFWALAPTQLNPFCQAADHDVRRLQ